MYEVLYGIVLGADSRNIQQTQKITVSQSVDFVEGGCTRFEVSEVYIVYQTFILYNVCMTTKFSME